MFTGDARGAEAEYGLALEADASVPALWVGRANARIAAGDGAGARSDLDRGLTLQADHPEGLLLLGAGTGDRAGARSDLEAFLSTAPRHPQRARAQQALEQLR